MPDSTPYVVMVTTRRALKMAIEYEASLLGDMVGLSKTAIARCAANSWYEANKEKNGQGKPSYLPHCLPCKDAGQRDYSYGIFVSVASRSEYLESQKEGNDEQTKNQPDTLHTLHNINRRGYIMTLTSESALRKDKRNAAGNLNGTLQHRHFAVIAGIIASMPDHAATLRTAKRSVALQFAGKLADTNQHFDRRRFLKACGVED